MEDASIVANGAAALARRSVLPVAMGQSGGA